MVDWTVRHAWSGGIGFVLFFIGVYGDLLKATTKMAVDRIIQSIRAQSGLSMIVAICAISAVAAVAYAIVCNWRYRYVVEDVEAARMSMRQWWTEERSIDFRVAQGASFTTLANGTVRLRIYVRNLGPHDCTVERMRFAMISAHGCGVHQDMQALTHKVELPPLQKVTIARHFEFSLPVVVDDGAPDVVMFELIGGKAEVRIRGSESAETVNTGNFYVAVRVREPHHNGGR